MNSNGLFNPVGTAKEEKQNTEQYRVSFKEGNNGVYRSVVRFVPNFADPSKCTMSKLVSWVKNPITQKGMYIDDPRSVGRQSPITDMYFNLVNTEIATYVDWAKKHIGAKRQYASLVQIMQDEQHPELVGQIKVFVYGKKVYEKLVNEETPISGQQGINPFHPIYGRKFSIVCTSQSGFNNFDQSAFFDERNGNQLAPSGMWYIDPQTPNQYSIVDENTNPDVLMEYLSKNSPDLSKYDFHEWTEEQTKHVEEVLNIARNYINTGSMMPSTGTNTPTQPTIGVAPTPSFNPTPQFPGVNSTVQPVPSVTPTPVPSATPAVDPTQIAPTPTVTGVVPPAVTPKVANTGTPPAPQQGINVDDILNQL